MIKGLLNFNSAILLITLGKSLNLYMSELPPYKMEYNSYFAGY